MRKIYQHSHEEEVVGDTKITVVEVEVKEEEALLTREDLLKTQILFVVFVGEMATTRTSVGVNAKSVEMQITLNKIVGIEKTVRRKMPTSPKRKKEISEPQNFDEAAKEEVTANKHAGRRFCDGHFSSSRTPSHDQEDGANSLEILDILITPSMIVLEFDGYDSPDNDGLSKSNMQSTYDTEFNTCGAKLSRSPDCGQSSTAGNGTARSSSRESSEAFSFVTSVLDACRNILVGSCILSDFLALYKKGILECISTLV
ncbi:hypothetical protein Salat_0645400 [Sesamum alatum]|uniref:Uncharacterized protein n=1 Tax=Sesamum alatum TaxID=300844 RepID=A0AAE2CUC9_9LAMI|nr:hypothetical protein Salat_0645400 [Sesamum alatum]